jgi:chromate transporter
MKRNLMFYFKLFYSTFMISAFTFGGGYVIVPLLRKKFVEDLKWIDEKEMLNITAIAQATPGAIAVNTSVLIGYHLSGLTGALFTILGTVLPPFLIISVISIAYTAFRDSIIVTFILKGMQAGVSAVIIDVVYNMIIEMLGEKKITSFIIAICSFIAAYFLKVNVAIIILACGTIGALTFNKKHKQGKE